MTIICVNGSPVEKLLSDDLTFEELVQKINCSNKFDSVVTQLLIDGVEVDAEDFSGRRVKRYSFIDITTKSKASLAFDCLKACQRYIDAIIEINAKIVASFQQSQIGRGNQQFIEMVELSELFVDLFSKVNHTLRSSFVDKYQKSAASTQVELTLLNILKQVYRAKEDGDLIMLCDLLEYELTDNLLEWKQKVIPELEKLKDN